MLISKNLQRTIRVLLCHEQKKIGVRELAKLAKISVGSAAKELARLEKIGYLEKSKNKYKLVEWEDLLNAFAYTTSIKEIEPIQFIAAERPGYVMKKISSTKLEYAFTAFTAAELVSPEYIADKLYLYIREDQKEEWEEFLRKQGMVKGEKGNILLYPVEEQYFYGTQEIRRFKVVCLAQLYADLFSISALGRGLSKKLLEVIRSVRSS